MSDENKSTAKDSSTSNGILDNLLTGQAKEIFNLLNQPAISSTALGLILYKVLDPAGTKSKLDKLVEVQKEMIQVLLEQSKELEKIRKKISQIREQLQVDYPNESASEKSAGRNNGKLSGNSYLD